MTEIIYLLPLILVLLLALRGLKRPKGLIALDPDWRERILVDNAKHLTYKRPKLKVISGGKREKGNPNSK